MNGFSWLELTLLLPILGAVVVSFIKVAGVAMRTSLGFFTATLLTSVAANLTFPGTKIGWLKHFTVDDLAAPMLPVLPRITTFFMAGSGGNGDRDT